MDFWDNSGDFPVSAGIIHHVSYPLKNFEEAQPQKKESLVMGVMKLFFAMLTDFLEEMSSDPTEDNTKKKK